MNIFYLDTDPVLCARYHHDKHVVKMLLELGQLLSNTYRYYVGTLTKKPSKSGKRLITHYYVSDPKLESALYTVSHINHPCSIWLRQSYANYVWGLKLLSALNDEYKLRYNKNCDHLTYSRLYSILIQLDSEVFPLKNFTEPPKAVYEIYKQDNTLKTYRAYYIGEKAHQSKYTNRETPSWLVNTLK